MIELTLNNDQKAALSGLGTNLAGPIQQAATEIATAHPDLAGLVGITAGCDAVSPAGAALIGAICGVVMIFSVDFIDKFLKIDDPVGASSVHGVCGFLGTILTGLFSTSEGLFYGYGFGFLGAQLFGALVVSAWAAGMGFIIFKTLDKIHGLRVPARVEEEGLDIYEHGESAYN